MDPCAPGMDEVTRIDLSGGQLILAVLLIMGVGVVIGRWWDSAG